MYIYRYFSNTKIHEKLIIPSILLVMQEVRLSLHSEPDGPVTGNGAFKSSVLMPGYWFGLLTSLYFSDCYIG